MNIYLIQKKKKFFELNNVEINAKKTQVIARQKNPNADTYLEFGSPRERIYPVQKSEAVRILGVWVTADGKPKATQRLVENDVDTICSILSKKAVTDRMATYIINGVLIPKVIYKTAVQIMSSSFVRKITGKYLTVCKKKAHMPSTTPNSIMHHNRLYAVKSLADAQAEEQVSTFFLRLNDQGLVGKVCRARLLMLQIRNKMNVIPTKDPASVKAYRHNIASSICRIMTARGISFDVCLAKDYGLPNNAITLGQWIDQGTAAIVGQHLTSKTVSYVEEIVEGPPTQLISWNQFRRRYKGSKASPQWYHTLQNYCHGSNYTDDTFERLRRERVDMMEDTEESQEEYNPISEVEGETENEEEAMERAVATLGLGEIEKPRPLELVNAKPRPRIVERPKKESSARNSGWNGN